MRLLRRIDSLTNCGHLGWILLGIAVGSSGCSTPSASVTATVGASTAGSGGSSGANGSGSGASVGGTSAGGGTVGGAGGAGGTGGSTGEGGAGGAGGAREGGSVDPCAKWFGGVGPASRWVYVGSDGKLAYMALDPQGDRIMDFSYAGYMGGGVAIPNVPSKATVSPTGSDDTSAIQTAIDTVSKLPLTGGVRGAVLLNPGTYQVSGPLRIGVSGVVLRGSGSGPSGTIVQITGASHNLILLSGNATLSTMGTAATITDAYVPSGARSFTVDSTAGFALGDTVLVRRPVTEAWVHFMGMDTLVRGDAGQTWLSPGSTHDWQRKIVAIAGNQVTVDIALSDSFDSKYVTPPGGSMIKYTYTGLISQVGVEHMRIVSPPRSATLENYLLRLDDMIDGWVKDVTANNFTRGVITQPGAKRVTIEDVALTHDPDTYFTSAAPFDFSVNSSEILVQRCSSTGGNKIWYYATESGARGPNVVLDFTASGMCSHVSPHQRWATGLLIDGANVMGGISLGNNGTAGDGYGWDIGWGVIWNCVANTGLLAPPGSMNWAIGCTGTPGVPEPTPGITDSPLWPIGTYDSQNTPVTPTSLYLAQLCERLGPAAVSNIGY